MRVIHTMTLIVFDIYKKIRLFYEIKPLFGQFATIFRQNIKFNNAKKCLLSRADIISAGY